MSLKGGEVVCGSYIGVKGMSLKDGEVGGSGTFSNRTTDAGKGLLAGGCSRDSSPVETSPLTGTTTSTGWPLGDGGAGSIGASLYSRPIVCQSTLRHREEL